MNGQAGITELISGNELKAAAESYLRQTQAKIQAEQNGLPGIFDKWFAQTLASLRKLDSRRAWEESAKERAVNHPHEAQGLQWDLRRLRLFLDRWRQGRFVSFASRERSGRHYYPRFGTEFDINVLLTCQGAPSLMRWRGAPLMKNIFDFAIYPALIAELRPRTIFEIGSGAGASAAWFADHLALCGVDGRVHSVDLVKPQLGHANVTFHRDDCARPETLFSRELLLQQPHPWLFVEDAHQNVGGVLRYFHGFLQPGDYLVVEDSDVKRGVLREFHAVCPNAYLVDTRFTDYFGRNATCAGDSIFVRTER